MLGLDSTYQSSLAAVFCRASRETAILELLMRLMLFPLTESSERPCTKEACPARVRASMAATLFWGCCSGASEFRLQSYSGPDTATLAISIYICLKLDR